MDGAARGPGIQRSGVRVTLQESIQIGTSIALFFLGLALGWRASRLK